MYVMGGVEEATSAFGKGICKLLTGMERRRVVRNDWEDCLLADVTSSQIRLANVMFVHGLTAGKDILLLASG